MAKKLMQGLFVLVLLFFCGVNTLSAKEITLSWDPSPSSGVTGYKVYYQGDSNIAPLTGTEASQGRSPVDVGNVTSVTLSSLDDGMLYSFAVTAYNASGESAYSNIVTEGIADDVPASGTYPVPVLGSVQTSNGNFILQWSNSGSPAGGYDIVIDGVDTNATHRTTQQSTTLSGLSTGRHCFAVQARYIQTSPDQFLTSTEVCADSTIVDPDRDGDGYAASVDCDDGNTSIHPGAPEIFNNGVDENCNGMSDDVAATASYLAPVPTSVQTSDSDFVFRWSLPAGSATPSGGYDIIIDGVDTNATHRTTQQSTTIRGLSTGRHCLAVQARYTQASPDKFLTSTEVCADSTDNDGDDYAAPVLGSVQASNGDFILQWSNSGSPLGGYDIVIDGVDTNSTNRTTQKSTILSGLSGGQHCFAIQARYTQASPDKFLTSNEVCGNSTENDEGRIEVGQVEIDHNWKIVTLASDFNDPVVIMGPPTYNSSHPGLVRIRNVQSNSFEVQFAEWTYQNGWHPKEDVSYLVMERGRHEMPDGSVWEVGSFYLGQTGAMAKQNYLQGFFGSPALLLTVQTCDEPSKPVVARARYVDGNGFEACLFTQESLMGSHGEEEVGYLAAWKSNDAGSISVNGQTLFYEMWELGVGSNFVEMGGYAVKLQEETSADSEVTHVVEQVSMLQVGEKVFMQPVSCEGMDTVTCRFK